MEQPDKTGRQRAHDEFVDPGPLPPGADVEAAEAHLLAALEHELGVPIAPEPGPAVARTLRTPERERRGLFAWWTGTPRLRPALAFAVVVVAAAGLLWSQGALRREREAPLLRGPDGTAAPGAWAALPLATTLDDGRTKLAWAPAAQATSYAVIFLGDDLAEIARVGDLSRTTLVLDRGALPAGLHAGQAVLWRVTAYAGRDEVARSGTSPLTLP